MQLRTIRKDIERYSAEAYALGNQLEELRLLRDRAAQAYDDLCRTVPTPQERADALNAFRGCDVAVDFVREQHTAACQVLAALRAFHATQTT
jgi:hypothetical protein